MLLGCTPARPRAGGALARPQVPARTRVVRPPMATSSDGGEQSPPPPSGPPPMTTEQACDVLGVTELTPFPDVVAARDEKLSLSGDEAAREQVRVCVWRLRRGL
jgi:hypothetical protein